MGAGAAAGLGAAVEVEAKPPKSPNGSECAAVAGAEVAKLEANGSEEAEEEPPKPNTELLLPLALTGELEAKGSLCCNCGKFVHIISE